ncbi:hypothetical protein CISIN_1g038524mg, partial [Citrus sinensis]
KTSWRYQSIQFNDTSNNHVGIDVNRLTSVGSVPATYFSDEKGTNKSLKLISGDPMQTWIDYMGSEKLHEIQCLSLSTSVDLSQLLLDTMCVGFSAATGSLATEHYILGCSLNKSGQAGSLNISTLPSFHLPTRKQQKLVTCVILVALVSVLTTVGAAVYIVRKKKYDEVYEDWER